METFKQVYGLIGKPLEHSLSPQVFRNIWNNEKLYKFDYRLFPLDKISDIRKLLETHKNIAGLNVTSPYKKAVLPFIDELDKTASDTAAVNTIKVQHIGNSILLKGYNTDVQGFEKAYGEIISENGGPALILGSGGASDSISYILKKRNIKFKKVSRAASKPELLPYKKINAASLKNFNIIINATPIGMFPKIDEFPPIPYAGIKKTHILIDLIYRPEETIFLKMGRIQQAQTYNGESMLIEQASYAWKIWNHGK